MMNPRLKFFVCDLPYSLSIQEGLLMRQGIENEMSQQTFSDISFSDLDYFKDKKGRYRP